MATTSSDLAGYADWTTATLVAVPVVLDGYLGVYRLPTYLGGGSSPLPWPPVDATAVVLGSTVLAALALVAGCVAAGLRSPERLGVALLGTPVVVAYALTGLLLPWDQLSYWVGSLLLDLTLAVPVVGSPVARLLFGGVTLGQATLVRAFVVHYGIVVVAGLALLAWVGRRAVHNRESGDGPR